MKTTYINKVFVNCTDENKDGLFNSSLRSDKINHAIVSVYEKEDKTLSKGSIEVKDKLPEIDNINIGCYEHGILQSDIHSKHALDSKNLQYNKKFYTENIGLQLDCLSLSNFTEQNQIISLKNAQSSICESIIDNTVIYNNNIGIGIIPTSPGINDILEHKNNDHVDNNASKIFTSSSQDFRVAMTNKDIIKTNDNSEITFIKQNKIIENSLCVVQADILSSEKSLIDPRITFFEPSLDSVKTETGGNLTSKHTNLTLNDILEHEKNETADTNITHLSVHKVNDEINTFDSENILMKSLNIGSKDSLLELEGNSLELNVLLNLFYFYNNTFIPMNSKGQNIINKNNDTFYEINCIEKINRNIAYDSKESLKDQKSLPLMINQNIEAYQNKALLAENSNVNNKESLSKQFYYNASRIAKKCANSIKVSKTTDNTIFSENDDKSLLNIDHLMDFDTDKNKYKLNAPVCNCENHITLYENKMCFVQDLTNFYEEKRAQKRKHIIINILQDHYTEITLEIDMETNPENLKTIMNEFVDLRYCQHHNQFAMYTYHVYMNTSNFYEHKFEPLNSHGRKLLTYVCKKTATDLRNIFAPNLYYSCVYDSFTCSILLNFFITSQADFKQISDHEKIQGYRYADLLTKNVN
ncbi:hypothetical protein COBT_002921 [Conglomerata obtusa]